jgi:predicted sugar kinase
VKNSSPKPITRERLTNKLPISIADALPQENGAGHKTSLTQATAFLVIKGATAEAVTMQASTVDRTDSMSAGTTILRQRGFWETPPSDDITFDHDSYTP